MQVVIASNKKHVYSCNGKMPWHCPEDLKHFKNLTTGGCVIMGGATWRSLSKKQLPNRLNIVVSKTEGSSKDGPVVFNSFEKLQNNIDSFYKAFPRKVFCIGGANFIDAVDLEFNIDIVHLSSIKNDHFCKSCKKISRTLDNILLSNIKSITIKQKNDYKTFSYTKFILS